MGLFKRIFKVGEAEAHAAIDKLENPIKMTEQGIRDLKKQLDKSLQSLAEVKSVAIRTKKEMTDNASKAKNYEHKAVQLIQKAQSGEMPEEESNRLATEALKRKEEAERQVQQSTQQYNQLQGQISQLNNNVEKLKSNIAKYENELKMLKARYRVSQATTKLNKSMANVDSSGTISMLEKMKDKVDQQESLAQAYGEISGEGQSIDNEIDDALSDSSEVSASNALEDLKAKLNKK